jgi:hypothetical protein
MGGAIVLLLNGRPNAWLAIVCGINAAETALVRRAESV